jgi:predicted nucleic acid-binding protein
MSDPVFVDTNVFIYALDESDPQKQQPAREWRNGLWSSRRGRTSFQVLQELYVKVTHKWPQHVEAARGEVRDLLAWRPVAVNPGLLQESWKIQDRYRFSFWDALIIAAAKAASCPYLLTEDLQADQDLGGILVINPFQRSFSSLE